MNSPKQSFAAKIAPYVFAAAGALVAGEGFEQTEQYDRHNHPGHYEKLDTQSERIQFEIGSLRVEINKYTLAVKIMGATTGAVAGLALRVLDRAER